MATVRIYKVAELLGTTSQEVLSLLKREHGIELKSASSTVEEVVARSFVERMARQRGISLPGGDMFAEHPVPAKGGGKKAPVAKKAEPPKPTAPVLGPPRLVKVVRPAAPAAEPEPQVPLETVAAAAPAVAEPPAQEPPAPPVAEPAATIQAPPPAPVEEPPQEAPPPPVEEPAPVEPEVQAPEAAVKPVAAWPA